MNSRMIAGIILIAVGAIVLLRGASFTKREDVLKVGDLKVTADTKESIPPWTGGIAIIAGVALVATAGRKRL